MPHDYVDVLAISVHVIVNYDADFNVVKDIMVDVDLVVESEIEGVNFRVSY